MDTPFNPDTQTLTLCLDAPAPRLDKALAGLVPAHIADSFGLSRAKIAKLIQDGQLTDENGEVIRKLNAKGAMGAVYTLHLTAPPADETAQPEDIALNIIYEDDDLIVINKPANMVVHPAVGNPRGTVLNALLYHCKHLGGGVGERTGIVHRIDKDTTGLLVAAKTDQAHAGLSAQFRDHSIKRHYIAVAIGVPSPADPRLMGLSGVSAEDGGLLRIATQIARHRFERKRMAVVLNNGRGAITRIKVLETFGEADKKPIASLIQCRLQTGRTHQIRLHLSHIGHGLIGDQMYGRARRISLAGYEQNFVNRVEAFTRQALHAASLGFIHPKTGEFMEFESDLPDDMLDLVAALRHKETS